MNMMLFQSFASALSCLESCNDEWRERHEETLSKLAERLPHGSGFDAGTVLDREKSTPNKLIFVTSFHHMTEHGYYDGWTEHNVIVTPDFVTGFSLRVTGRNRNDIKEFIADTFACALRERLAPVTAIAAVTAE